MLKRTVIFALLLAMLMSMFAGCSSETQTPEESPQQETQSVEEVPAEPEPPAEEQPPVEEPQEEPEPPDPNEGLVAGDEGYDWSVFQPVTEEPVTLTMFYTQPPMLSAIVEVPSDKSFVYQKLEELTNVTIDFVMINMMNASTDFSLMMAAGDMCDIVNDATKYYSSADLACDEGACIDILQYEDCMPNYMALMEEHSFIYEDLLTDAGRIVSFANITYPFERVADSGLMIRKDWLDELGMDIPVTYDQYHDVLAAFKSEYDISDPYVMPYNVLSPWGVFAGGYGLPLRDGDQNFYMEGDKIALATVSDAYYDWLSMFRDWYIEGLIGKDFMSFMENLPDQSLITSGQTGLWFSDTPYIKTYENLMAEADPNCVLDLAPDPAMHEDYSGYIYSENSVSVADGGFSVSENCEMPEIAVAWCDYWYDPDLRQFINYGHEGVTFEYDENGEPQLSGLITENEYGLTTRLANGLYLCTSGGFLNMTNKLNNDYSELQHKAKVAWELPELDPSKSSTSGLPEDFSLSADESSEISTIMADIVTYVTEKALKFVTGEIELNETTYQEYKDDINNMKLGEALAIMEGAYERCIASEE